MDNVAVEPLNIRLSLERRATRSRCPSTVL